MKTLFLVRHGESESNARGLVATRALNEPLTPRGRLQSEQTAQALAGLTIHSLYCSPLQRARQTADIIGAATFSPNGRTVNFAAGSDTATVTVNPLEDTIPESDETVILTVVPDRAYTAGDPSAATGTITNVEFAKFWVVDDLADDVFRYRAPTGTTTDLLLLDRIDVAPQAQIPRGVAMYAGFIAAIIARCSPGTGSTPSTRR